MNVGESATNDVEVRTPQSDDLAFESERETQDGQLCRLERVHCYDSLPSLDGAVDLGLDEPDDDEKPYRVSPARRVSCKINSGDDLSYGVKSTNLKDQSSLSFEDIQTLSKANIKPDVSLFPGSHEELQRRSDCRAEEECAIRYPMFDWNHSKYASWCMRRQLHYTGSIDIPPDYESNSIRGSLIIDDEIPVSAAEYRRSMAPTTSRIVTKSDKNKSFLGSISNLVKNLTNNNVQTDDKNMFYSDITTENLKKNNNLESTIIAPKEDSLSILFNKLFSNPKKMGKN
eukprot:GHVL01010799.1.p1 GENE.GHVL01010799.1~~GHVL01010799.1.p1  ORF type:complete len:286 (-),score=45.36 GHVL01010799.1:1070-1927(-)